MLLFCCRLQKNCRGGTCLKIRVVVFRRYLESLQSWVQLLFVAPIRLRHATHFSLSFKFMLTGFIRFALHPTARRKPVGLGVPFGVSVKL